MNHEIIALAKQFRFTALYDGFFSIEGKLSNEEYLLELFRAEAKNVPPPSGFGKHVSQPLRTSKNLTQSSKKASQENSCKP